jgi:hypothetical protein
MLGLRDQPSWERLIGKTLVLIPMLSCIMLYIMVEFVSTRTFSDNHAHLVFLRRQSLLIVLQYALNLIKVVNVITLILLWDKQMLISYLIGRIDEFYGFGRRWICFIDTCRDMIARQNKKRSRKEMIEFILF